jgi:hypothetical protein
MREPPEAWPAKKTFTPPPPEECKKDMLAMVKTARVRSRLWYPPSANTRAKLERVYGYVYTFLARARRLTNFTPITARMQGTGKEAVMTHSPPRPSSTGRQPGYACCGTPRQASAKEDWKG